MDRREELLEQVTDYTLEHGLIGLTLRPLARSIGTSDRMLIYHFGSRDDLVTAVIELSNERAIAALRELPPGDSVRDGVNGLWRAYGRAPLQGLLWLYYQAAATGLLGTEPYRSRTRVVNERWSEALRDHLVLCGAPAESAGRVTRLVDWGLCGFHFDLTTTRPEEVADAVDDLAVAAGRLAG